MIVAIDGPAGAGKSTVARRVADRLDFHLIDTGALYRIVALRALEAGLDPDDGEAIAELARALELDFSEDGLTCDGEVVGDEIRTPEVSQTTSQISSLPPVREALLGVQRRIGRRRDSVLEGRDIGTVVFPEAEVKIFLTATAEERGRRRWEELTERGESAELDEVVEEMRQRDKRDRSRDVAPLKQASDAVVVDSTELDPDEVVDRILAIVEDARGG
jgi:cytidylate kinase